MLKCLPQLLCIWWECNKTGRSRSKSASIRELWASGSMGRSSSGGSVQPMEDKVRESREVLRFQCLPQGQTWPLQCSIYQLQAAPAPDGYVEVFVAVKDQEGALTPGITPLKLVPCQCGMGHGHKPGSERSQGSATSPTPCHGMSVVSKCLQAPHHCLGEDCSSSHWSTAMSVKGTFSTWSKTVWCWCSVEGKIKY